MKTTYDKVKNVVLGVTAATTVVASAYAITNLVFKERDYSDLLVESAKKYVENNNLAIDSKYVTSVKNLRESGALVKDLKDECVDNSYITITNNEDGTYDYEPTLVCGTDESATSVEEDITTLTYEVKASSTNLTNKNVLVEVQFNQEVQNVEVQGWSLSSDKRVLKKIFTKNGEDEFEVKSLDGSKTVTVKVSASNIDKDAPVILANGKNVFSSYGVNVNLSVEDDNLDKVTVNGAELKSTSFTKTGNYEVVATDLAGNKSVASFSLIRETQGATILVPKEDVISSDSVKVTNVGSVTNILYKIDEDGNRDAGTTFNRPKTLTDEGKYEFVIADKNDGTELDIRHITIDKTAPIVWAVPYDINENGEIVEGSPVEVSGLITNKNVIIRFSDNLTNVKATSNEQKTVESGDSFVGKEDGIVNYKFTVTDEAGNASEFEFTINKQAPKIEGVEAGKFYNGSVTPSFGEGLTAELDNNEYTLGASIEAEGLHTLVVRDALGNESKLSFTIDLTAPEFDGFAEDETEIITGDDFVVNITDVNLESVVIVNDKGETINNMTLTVEGKYTLTATDKAGNETVKTVIVDKNDPKVTINNIVYTGKDNVISDHFEDDVRFAVEDLTEYKVYLDNKEDGLYEGEVVTSNGQHTLIVVDAVGRETTVTFTIVKNIPSITLSSLGKDVVIDSSNVDKKHYFKDNVMISFSNIDTISKAELNNSEGLVESITDFTKGTPINAGTDSHDEYTFVVTDIAGRKTTITFVIDTKMPIANVGSDLLKDNTTITFNDAAGIMEAYITSPDGVKTEINSGEYTMNMEGDYVLEITDNSGNKVVYYPTLDKSAPSVTYTTKGENNQDVVVDLSTLTAVENKIYLSKAGKLTFKDLYSNIRVTDKDGNHLVNFVGKEHAIDLSDGEYTFTVVDKAGHSVGEDGNEIIDENHSVSFNIVVDTKLDMPTLNTDYIKHTGTEFIDKVRLTLIIDEKAVKSVIDNNTNYEWEPVTSTDNKLHYELIISATPNGKAYTSFVTVTDMAGHSLPVEYTVTVDKTKPTFEIPSVTVDRTNDNVNVYLYASEELLSINSDENTPITWDMTSKELLSQESANYAGMYRYKGVASGNINNAAITVTDLNNNTSEEKTYSVSDIDKDVDITSITYSNADEFGNSTRPVKNSVIVTITAGEALTISPITINDIEIAWLPGEDNGTNGVYTYTAEVTENITDKEISISDGLTTVTRKLTVAGIDNEGPEVDFRETPIKTDSEGYALFNGGVTPITTSTDIKGYTLYKDGVEVSDSDYVLGETTLEVVEGQDIKYRLEVTDLAGNTTTKLFRIDNEKPTILEDTIVFSKRINGELVEIDKGSYTNGNVLVNFAMSEPVSISEQSAGYGLKYASLDDRVNLVFTKVMDGTINFKLTDDAGNESNIAITVHIDNVLPEVKFAKTDEDGNTIYEEVEADGKYNHDVEGIVITDNHDGVSATIQGPDDVEPREVDCSSPLQITGDGVHTLIVTDIAGNKVKYKFTIDTVSPVIVSPWFVDGKLYNDEEFYKNNNMKIYFNEGTATLYRYTTPLEYDEDGKVIIPEEPAVEEKEYTRGTPIPEEGYYILKIDDGITTPSVYSFGLDRTAPSVSENDVKLTVKPNQDKAYGQSVFIEFTTSEPVYMDSSFMNSNNNGCGEGICTTWSFTKLINGTVTFNFHDEAGNKGQLAVPVYNIDKTKPEVSGVENKAIYGSGINLEITYLDKDDEGNIVDEGVKAEIKGGLYGEELTDVSNDDKKIVVPAIDGIYTLVVTDRADNSVTYTFTVDLTAPEITLPTTDKVVPGTNIPLYKEAITPIYDGVGKLYKKITNADGTETLKLVSEYKKGDSINESGNYTIIATDEVTYGTPASNQKDFSIDLTVPSIKEDSVSVKKNTSNQDLRFTLESPSRNLERIVVDETDLTNENVSLTFTMDEAVTMDENSKSWGLKTSEDGKTFTFLKVKNSTVRFTLTDAAGNEKIVEFVVNNIDTKKPTAKEIEKNQIDNTSVELTLKIDKEIDVENFKENGVSVSDWHKAEPPYEDETITDSEGNEVTTRWYIYTKLVEANTEGLVTVEFTDAAGNTGTATYEVTTIDIDAPVLEILNPEDEAIKGVDGIDVYATTVQVKVTDPNLAGISYSLDNGITWEEYTIPENFDGIVTFSNEGEYLVKAIDSFDAKADPIAFAIDVLPPQIVLDEVNLAVENSTLYNGPVTITVTEANLKSATYKVGDGEPQPIDWDSQENGVYTVTLGAFDGTENGLYVISITDVKGGEATTIEFEIDSKVMQVVPKYVPSVSEGYASSVDVIVKADEKLIISEDWVHEDDDVEVINGKTFYIYTKTVIENTKGKVQVSYTDLALNEGTFEYEVTNIDTKSPTLAIEGTQVNDIYTGTVTITAEDPENHMGTVTYKLKDSEGDATLITPNEQGKYILPSNIVDGVYIITANDLAGHSKQEEITVDRNAPIITFNDNAPVIGTNTIYVLNKNDITGLLSGLLTVTDTMDENPTLNVPSVDETVDGVVTYSYTASDNVGHTSDSFVIEFKIIDLSAITAFESRLRDLEDNASTEENINDYFTSDDLETRKNEINSFKAAITSLTNGIVDESNEKYLTPSNVAAEITRLTKIESLGVYDEDEFKDLVIKANGFVKTDYNNDVDGFAEAWDKLFGTGEGENKVLGLVDTKVAALERQSQLNAIVEEMKGYIETIENAINSVTTNVTFADDESGFTIDGAFKYAVDYSNYNTIAESLKTLLAKVANEEIKLQSVYDAELESIMGTNDEPKLIQITDIKGTSHYTSRFATLKSKIAGNEASKYTSTSVTAYMNKITEAENIAKVTDGTKFVHEFIEALDALEAVELVPKKTASEPTITINGESYTDGAYVNGDDEIFFDFVTDADRLVVVINGEPVTPRVLDASTNTYRAIYDVPSNTYAEKITYSITPYDAEGNTGTAISGEAKIVIDSIPVTATTDNFLKNLKGVYVEYNKAQTRKNVFIRLESNKELVSFLEGEKDVTEKWTTIPVDTTTKPGTYIYTLEVLEDCEGTLSVIDKANNRNENVTYAVSGIDHNAPLIVVQEGKAEDKVNDTLFKGAVNVTITDVDVESISWKLNGIVTNIDLSTIEGSELVLPFEAEGQYEITVLESANADSPITELFTIDTEKPVISIKGNSLIVVTDENDIASLMPEVSVEDTVDKTVKLDEPIVSEENGVRTITYNATDNAGHHADSKSIEIRIIDISALTKIEDDLKDLENKGKDVTFETALVPNIHDYKEASVREFKEKIAQLKKDIAGNGDVELEEITQGYVTDRINSLGGIDALDKEDVNTNKFVALTQEFAGLNKDDFNTSPEFEASWTNVEGLVKTKTDEIDLQSTLNAIVKELKTELGKIKGAVKDVVTNVTFAKDEDGKVISMTVGTEGSAKTYLAVNYNNFSTIVGNLKKLLGKVEDGTVIYQSDFDSKVTYEIGELDKKAIIDSDEYKKFVELETAFNNMTSAQIADYTETSYEARKAAILAAREFADTNTYYVSDFIVKLDAVKNASLVEKSVVTNVTVRTENGKTYQGNDNTYIKEGGKVIVNFQTNGTSTLVVINNQPLKPEDITPNYDSEGNITSYDAVLEVGTGMDANEITYAITPSDGNGTGKVTEGSAKVVIDTTIPEFVSVDAVSPEGPTNQFKEITIRVNEEVITTNTGTIPTVQVLTDENGNKYSLLTAKRSSLGKYTFMFEDLAGNKGKYVYDVTGIDKVKPEGTLYSVTPEGPINTFKTITIKVNEEVVPNNTQTPVSAEVKTDEDGNKYTLLSADRWNNGDFTFLFTDLAGNSGLLKVNVSGIDKTPAKGSTANFIKVTDEEGKESYAEYKNDGTSKDVYIRLTSDKKLKAIEDVDADGNVVHTWDTTSFEPDGTDYIYTLRVSANTAGKLSITDEAGNVTNNIPYDVRNIDKTAPGIALIGTRYEQTIDKKVYTSDVTVKITEDSGIIASATYTYNGGDAQTIDTTGMVNGILEVPFTNAGTYTVTVTNVGKTTVTETFIIDKEVPVITLTGKTVIVVTDANLVEGLLPKATVSDDSDTEITYSKSSSTPVDGAYTITYSAKDHAGRDAENKTVEVRVIDLSGLEPIEKNLEELEGESDITKPNISDYTSESVQAQKDAIDDLRTYVATGNEEITQATVRTEIERIDGLLVKAPVDDAKAKFNELVAKVPTTNIDSNYDRTVEGFNEALTKAQNLAAADISGIDLLSTMNAKIKELEDALKIIESAEVTVTDTTATVKAQYAEENYYNYVAFTNALKTLSDRVKDPTDKILKGEYDKAIEDAIKLLSKKNITDVDANSNYVVPGYAEFVALEREFNSMAPEQIAEYTSDSYNARKAAIEAARTVANDNTKFVSDFTAPLNAVKAQANQLVRIPRIIKHGITTSNANKMYAKAGDIVTVTFESKVDLVLVPSETEELVSAINFLNEMATIRKVGTRVEETTGDTIYMYESSLEVKNDKRLEGKVEYTIFPVGPNQFVDGSNIVPPTESSFTVDVTAPELDIDYKTGTIVNGAIVGGETYDAKDGKTNKNVVITLSSNEVLNTITDTNAANNGHWKDYVSGEVELRAKYDNTYMVEVSADCDGTLTVTDAAGNEATITYDVNGIDKIHATGNTTNFKADKDGNITTDVYSNNGTNTDVYIKLTASEKLKAISSIVGTNATYTWDVAEYEQVGNDYIYTIKVAEDVSGTISITDEAGNITGGIEYSVIGIDKDAPKLKVVVDTYGTLLYSGTATATVYEGTLTDSYDGEEKVLLENVTGETTVSITGTGVHKLKVTDSVGNYTEYEVRLDQEKPTITLKDKDGNTVTVPENGIFLEDVYIEVSDNITPVEDIIVTGATTGSLLVEGNYTVTVTDEFGNTDTVEFKIDLDKPTINVVGTPISEGSNIYKGVVTVTINDSKELAAATYTLNGGNEQSITIENGVATLVLPEDGTYVFNAVDAAGRNAEAETLVLDTNAPVIEGIEDGQVNDLAEITVTVRDANLTNVSWVSTINGVTSSSNEAEIVDGVATIKFTKEGIYTITAVDKANASVVKTFTIERGDVVISGLEQNKTVYTEAITVGIDKGILKVGGEVVTDNSIDLSDGEYTIVVISPTGKEVVNTHIVIDTKDPKLTILYDNAAYSNDFSITLEARNEAFDASKYFTYTASDEPNAMTTVTVTKTQDNVNLAVPTKDGSPYVVTYTATDGVGRKTNINIEVNVKDRKAPTITLNSPSEAIEVLFGGKFADPYGATATDTLDGAVEVTSTNDVDTFAVGEYTVTYTAVDKAGNSATATRKVIVKTNTAGQLFRTANLCREGTQCYGSYSRDNYVWYSGHLWRVIKVNPDNSLKLITDDSAAGFSYGSNASGSSFYDASYAQKWLNNVFYPALNNADNMVVTGEFCKQGNTSTSIRYVCDDAYKVQSKVGMLTIDEYRILAGQNGFLNNGDRFFTMTPTSGNTAWVIHEDGSAVANHYVNEPYAIRPVINIKNTVNVLSGTGKVDDPFILDEAKTADSNLVNKTSGEYVMFGGRAWRIVSSSSVGTKLIADDYVAVDNIYSNVEYGTIGKFSTTSGVGNFLQVNIYNKLGAYQQYVVKTNYNNNKYSLGQDPTTTLNNGTNMSAYVGLIRVGELMSGSTSTGRVTNMTSWMMTSTSSGKQWFITDGGTSEYASNSNVHGLRPVITLAPTVKVKTGEGTASNPYELDM